MRTPEVRAESSSSSMTSMIDVVFLLLIFFLCTLNYRVLEGRLDTELPMGFGQDTGDVLEVLEPLELHVLNDPRALDGTRVRIGRGQSHAVSELPSVLAGLAEAFPLHDVVIHAGDGVAHGQVVSVVDACVAGGFLTLRFAAG